MTFPTARPILERLAYAGYLAALAGGFSATWLGALTLVFTGDFRMLIAGLGGLALARWLHVQGFARWHFRECSASLDALGAGPEPTVREKALTTEVAQLLERLEAEEGVWQRAELRREIAGRLAAAPVLRETLAEALRAHPEL